MTGSGCFSAKGPSPHPSSIPPSFCQAQSEAHGPPSAMAVRKRGRCKLTGAEVVCTASPYLPTQGQSKPGAATQNQWDAASTTARTEHDVAVCTMCTQWSVCWPAT